VVSARELDAMTRALDLAARGPATGPNPRVGCVLLAPDGHVLAEGYHRGAGTAHAEVDALQQLRGSADGATAIVTLEPCAHTGRTGPCSQALLAAGVVRVVVATADPNPQAAGGIAELAAHGVDVEVGVLEERARALNERWSTAVGRGRPWVTWKFAATLDGRSAAADGTSRWITAADARADVHRLRSEHDAVLVGTGTALTDDPSLTVRRDGVVTGPQPLRVVAGFRDLPAHSRLLDDAAETLHVRSRDPHTVLAELARREVRSVFLEGGPTLAAEFFARGLVDEVVGYLAPALLGSGTSAVGDLGIRGMPDIARLQITSVAVIGEDVRLVARPRARPAAVPHPTDRSVQEFEFEEVVGVHRDR